MAISDPRTSVISRADARVRSLPRNTTRPLAIRAP
jgi:hypothetical protein